MMLLADKDNKTFIANLFCTSKKVEANMNKMGGKWKIQVTT